MSKAKLANQSAISSFVAQWKLAQDQLRERLIVSPLDPLPRYVAGADGAFDAADKIAFAAAVVYDRQTQTIVELAHATRPIEYPYVPGYLSFREGPALLEAILKLKHEFGAILFDGQGYAHPRRCGLATHLSITLDVPGIGVAKSRFIGTHDDLAPEAGASAPLMDQGEQIGFVLRTRANTRPLFVSIGHRVDLDSALALVRACCTKYRVPEPTRQADIEVARLKRSSPS